MKEEKQDNVIVNLTFEFSLKIIGFSEELEHQKKYIIARQILKSGTSIGANVREAQAAESKADFIHKLKIAAKEAEETAYWLELCNASINYPSNHQLKDDLNAIVKVVSKIISSSKKS